MDDYRYPALIFHCSKCGKPYMLAAMASQMDAEECVEFNEMIRNAAKNNERMSIYYGDENPLKDGCECKEGQE